MLRHIAQGKCAKQISRDTRLSIGTIKTHLSAAYQRIGARDRAGAIVRVAQLAGIDLPAALDRLIEEGVARAGAHIARRSATHR